MTAPVTGPREHGFEPDSAITPFIGNAKICILEIPEYIQPSADKAEAATLQRTELHPQNDPRLPHSALDGQHMGQWYLVVGDNSLSRDPPLQKTRQALRNTNPFC